MRGLKNDHIIKIEDYGSEGYVLKPSGREIKNIVYLILEHIEGGLLFEICEKLGGMGEDVGRFFMTQMIDTLEYMHNKGVVHRDLKLENILLTDQLDLKIVDYGFATYKNIKRLDSFKGTKTYMAPEIKKGYIYDGRQADIFSTAVIVYIIVHGIFPFKEASKSDHYYNMIASGQAEKYWEKVCGDELTDDFKDLMTKMFHKNGLNRPTVKEIKNHPWMKKSYDHEATRQKLIEQYFGTKDSESDRRTVSTAGTTDETTINGSATVESKI